MEDLLIILKEIKQTNPNSKIKKLKILQKLTLNLFKIKINKLQIQLHAKKRNNRPYRKKIGKRRL